MLCVAVAVVREIGVDRVACAPFLRKRSLPDMEEALSKDGTARHTANTKRNFKKKQPHTAVAEYNNGGHGCMVSHIIGTPLGKH